MLEESKTPECKNKRRPVLAETVVSAWHNEKENKNQPLSLGYGRTDNAEQRRRIHARNLVSGQYRLNTRVLARYWYLRHDIAPSIRAQDKRHRPIDPKTRLKIGSR